MMGKWIVVGLALLLAGCSTQSSTQAPSLTDDKAGMEAGVNIAVANLRQKGMKPMTSEQCVDQHSAEATQTMNGVTYSPRELCIKVAEKYYGAPGDSSEENNRELFDLSESQVAEVKEAVAGTLKDPYSAQFEGLYGTRLKENADKYVICGMVNAKNSFGGYVGSKAFMYIPGSRVVFPGEPGSLDSEIVKTGCGG